MKLMILLKNLRIIMNKKVDDIIMEFKDYYKQKKVKLDDIFNLLTDLENIIIRKKINIAEIIIDFRDYYNQKITNVNR